MDQTKMETAEKLFMSCQFDKAFPILEFWKNWRKKMT